MAERPNQMALNWTNLDTWIVLTGFFAAAACALPGCYLVLRRMSLMGDAISHAVLPGLALAFIATGSRASVPMFLGAAAVGVLTAVFTQGVERLGKVETTAALGIVFTTLFAIGLILIRFGADHVDLDPDCVLYGAIEWTPLYTVSVLGWTVPQAALVNGSMFLINALFVLIFYKELKISSFDPQLATTLGINAQAMHYALMALVAATVVAAFESVGAILVIAMLIVPGAVAHLLTDRLSVMLGISLLVAAGCAVGGHVGAITVPPMLGFDHDTTTAGMMAVAAGAIFVGAMLASPRYGVISKALAHAALALRIAREDVLALLYRLEERSAEAQREGGAVEAAALPRELHLSRMTAGLAMALLERRGMVARRSGRVRLTDRGRRRARSLIRSHRLWETYLERYAALPGDHRHLSAERLEHATDPRLQDQLAQRIGGAETDPEGKRIPPRESR